MAKRVNPFAADFEGLNRSADDKVLAILESAVKSEDSARATTEGSGPRSPVAMQQAREEKRTVTSAPSKKRKGAKAKPSLEWGKPVAHFNTRIPEAMAGLLDDLVYKLRKRGEPKSKQDLAQEALCDLLRKYSLL